MSARVCSRLTSDTGFHPSSHSRCLSPFTLLSSRSPPRSFFSASNAALSAQISSLVSPVLLCADPLPRTPWPTAPGVSCTFSARCHCLNTYSRALLSTARNISHAINRIQVAGVFRHILVSAGRSTEAVGISSLRHAPGRLNYTAWRGSLIKIATILCW